MSKIVLFFKSRTFLVLAAMVAFNILQFFQPTIPAQYKAIVDLVMTALAGYYHVNPSQNYALPKVPPVAPPAPPAV